MKEVWLQKWEERYGQDEFAYGIAPNNYLKSQLEKLEPGKILFAAEGEGRNAVFAAGLGWKVAAFDISIEGKRKAMSLAEANHVEIDYQIGFLPDLGYTEAHFDAIALIYAHFPADIKSAYHELLSEKLRKGGHVIFEAFSKNHLSYLAKNKDVGGPTDADMLFSIEEIKNDFIDFEILELAEVEVQLSEGLYHNGTGSVIRFLGRKK
ncbi:bifunctional 2-polyprenyl-6-hydroxyphenol methylase/3-demethylubiquinol 3-O-methyltransferase UbiG [Pedobacter foliorum]|uniref:class I SAM-dependent methyltransferase n=1 Tax=Pedobacter foliorum TaxID=2739058 RepID=UPI0015647873|nr:class I SAM-dependent methyltransferase [Pedobacter foliorum]NRF40133.1 class I SAM-dependent methyltransferase [Pedobacter foliorum]